MKGMEKRLFPRKRIHTKVIFEDEFGESLIWVNAEDISLGGLYLSSPIPIKIGSYIFLSFYLPDKKRKIRATGQVVRVTGPSSDKSSQSEGMGIRFVGLSTEAIDAIREYLF